MKIILGTKIGMTQTIGEDGVVTPVTILQAGPCTVTQTKTVESDGYSAVQLAFGQGKNLSKAVSGHVEKSGEDIKPKHIREFRVDSIPEDVKLGSKIDVTHSATKFRLLAPAKVRVLLVLSSATTSRNHATRTVSRVTFVGSVLSVLCIHRRSSKARKCQAAWVMTA